MKPSETTRIETAYNAARETGLLPPLAAAVAAWRTMPAVAQSVRSIDPRGAAVIFGLAWLAGFAGSSAALAIVAALLAGLYVAKVQPAVPSSPAQPAAQQPAAVPADGAIVKVAAHPLSAMSEAMAAGLVVRKIELSQPAASNGRAKTVSK